jgi:hypothetical protein
MNGCVMKHILTEDTQGDILVNAEEWAKRNMALLEQARFDMNAGFLYAKEEMARLAWLDRKRHEETTIALIRQN